MPSGVVTIPVRAASVAVGPPSASSGLVARHNAQTPGRDPDPEGSFTGVSTLASLFCGELFQKAQVASTFAGASVAAASPR